MAGWKKMILAHYGMNWMSRPHFISHHWKQLPAIVPTLLRLLPADAVAHMDGAKRKGASSREALCRQCLLREHTFLHKLPPIYRFRMLLLKQLKEMIL